MSPLIWILENFEGKLIAFLGGEEIRKELNPKVTLAMQFQIIYLKLYFVVYYSQKRDRSMSLSHN